MAIRYELSQAADNDIEGLIEYTMQRFGRAQTQRYLAQIERQLEALIANPRLGQARDEIRPALRSRLVGQHLLFYRIKDEDTLRVVRVLHTSRDLQRFDETGSA
ncbi:type II toxin-antitoxin system RelE/ParE family toxin [Salinisphaera japonica]|uniref:Toxin n=1 Tax=Salinisphaera japonica YTM-1 TaxID=1209778 RepID=A0A423PPP5_9GAMM|nr:type II toxin-antitoxin system RelE/ParE family toxin [Salinisphaera japonica]ROO27563.1 plasmid stabilization protein [Salinisphaera japonica YTM-1]